MRLIERILPWAPVRLFGVSDVQFGAAGCVPHYYKADMKQARDENALCIGVGDMIDFVRPTMRKVMSATAADMEITRALGKEATSLEQEWLDISHDTRWAGMTKGHHYWQYGPAETSDTRLAAAMGCPFLGDVGIIRLTFKGRGHNQVSYDIWLWHGEGGAGYEGAMRKLALKATHWDVDMLLMGHHSQLGSRHIQKVRMTKGPGHQLQAYNVTLGLTGNYMVGYVVDHEVDGLQQGTYVEQRALNPLAIGCLKLTLTPQSDGVVVT